MQSTRDGTTWMLRLDVGEPLVDTIAAWADAQGVRAASVLAGIGMVRDTELGYYRGTAYDRARFDDPMELLGLAGSIAWEDDRPSIHLHLIGGRADHSAVGGHLFSTTVAVLAEITVRTFPDRTFRRPPIPGTVLRCLTFPEPPRRSAGRHRTARPR